MGLSRLKFQKKNKINKLFLPGSVYFCGLQNMRIRIGIFMAYLLLGCILLENALPCIAHSMLMEVCESTSEKGENTTKTERDIEADLSHVSVGFRNRQFPVVSILNAPDSILAASDEILDSACLSVFSPPPDKV